MAIDLTPFAERLEAAIADGTYCLVATNGTDGIPDVGFKGSMMVFNEEHLAYWERVRGQMLANVVAGSGAAVLYYNRERRSHVRFFGRNATVHAEGDVREAVMARTPQLELDRDPERKGVAVLIRIVLLAREERTGRGTTVCRARRFQV